ncbi:hypothetical protein EMCRGX_G000573 [Ephydatia muelleri]
MYFSHNNILIETRTIGAHHVKRSNFGQWKSCSENHVLGEFLRTLEQPSRWVVSEAPFSPRGKAIETHLS